MSTAQPSEPEPSPDPHTALDLDLTGPPTVAELTAELELLQGLLSEHGAPLRCTPPPPRAFLLCLDYEDASLNAILDPEDVIGYGVQYGEDAVAQLRTGGPAGAPCRYRADTAEQIRRRFATQQPARLLWSGPADLTARDPATRP